MRIAIFVLFHLALGKDFPQLDVLRAQASGSEQIEAVSGLLYRLIPKQAWQFRLQINSSLTPDYVEVRSGAEPVEIQIEGSSGVALAWGVQLYLRACCNAHFSWDGNRLDLPSLLPPLHEPITSHSVGRFRYASNVCTFSYSYVWWGWEEWERFVDWLALNGVNLPLAHVGREAIWRRVWRKRGLNDSDIDDFFTGPAFLAWQRMGNLRKWGGPLSDNWHRQQESLQKAIVGRMRSLGMVPVLPAFAGFVPRSLKKLYPQAKITPMNNWVRFSKEYTGLDFLDPTDPLFKSIGTEYLRELNASYGSFHAFSADSFNEMLPTSLDPAYLGSVTKGIYSAMQSFDPDAVWVMQAWLFLSSVWTEERAKAFLQGVPEGKLLLLDLFSESDPQYTRYQSFYGQPFIWNMLTDFGGNLELIGSQQFVNEGVSKGLSFPNTTMVGTGITMEGIYQNYVLYQFMLDRSWGQPPFTPIDSKAWAKSYAIQRYGTKSEDLKEAWATLWATIYSACADSDSMVRKYGDDGHHSYVNFIFKRPEQNQKFDFWFDPKLVCRAWKSFVSQTGNLYKNDLFRLDLVDLSRQIMEFVAIQKYYRLQSAFDAKNSTGVTEAGQDLLTTLDELDQLLNTHPHFMLGRWIQEARAKATTPQEADQYEWNLRNQLTLWGPNGEIRDYARKQWGGLIKDYYRPRWALYVRSLHSALEKRVRWNKTAFNEDLFRLVDKPFTLSKIPPPFTPTQDTIRVLKPLFTKYYPLCILLH